MSGSKIWSPSLLFGKTAAILKIWEILNIGKMDNFSQNIKENQV
jgi:hypothetical protein